MTPAAEDSEITSFASFPDADTEILSGGKWLAPMVYIARVLLSKL